MNRLDELRRRHAAADQGGGEARKQRLRDFVPAGTRPAHEQHIVLVNRDEIQAARGARAET